MNNLVAFIAAVLVVPPARAATTPSFLTKLHAVPGQWAEYQVTTVQPSGKTGVMKVRIAAVGKSSEGTWLESRMTMVSPKPKHPMPPETVKFLMNAHEVVTRAYVQTPRGVMDMSGSMSAISLAASAKTKKIQRKKVGADKITVPAGSFEAVRYAISGDGIKGDVWTKSGVGPYGLVHQVMHSNDVSSTFDLLAYGTGAKSEVDESQARAFPAVAFPTMAPRAPAPTAAQPQAAPPQASEAPASAAASAPSSDSNSDQPSQPSQSVGGFLGRAIKSRLGL